MISPKTLVMFIITVIIAGLVLHYILRPKLDVKEKASCSIVLPAIPMVNTTIGMAMSASATECK